MDQSLAAFSERNKLGQVQPRACSWIEVRAIFETEPDDWSLAAGALAELGCNSSRIESSPPAIVSCVANIAGHLAKISKIQEAMSRLGASSQEIKLIPDEDWMDSFRKHFTSREIGEKFVVIPSWDAEQDFGNRLQIHLDPGQAFGTGDHPTTQMCLQILEKVDLEGKSVLDLGCGSGILAIGAKLLGAGTVVAADIELLSAKVATDNFAKNQVQIEAVAMAGMDGFSKDAAWDLIISNIISATLIRLAYEISCNLNAGGKWIVSGIISANWPDVLQEAQKFGLNLTEIQEENGWVAACFTKP